MASLYAAMPLGGRGVSGRQLPRLTPSAGVITAAASDSCSGGRMYSGNAAVCPAAVATRSGYGHPVAMGQLAAVATACCPYRDSGPQRLSRHRALATVAIP